MHLSSYKSAVSITLSIIPRALFKGIKEAVTKPIERDHLWEDNFELEPEVGEALETSPATITNLPSQPWESHYVPPSDNDYYLELIRTALSQGGRRGAYEIPIPWLRMTFAGLQGQYIDPEDTWGIEASESFDRGPDSLRGE